MSTFQRAFHLAGEYELAERLTLKLPRRPDQSEDPEESLEETSETPNPGVEAEPS